MVPSRIDNHTHQMRLRDMWALMHHKAHTEHSPIIFEGLKQALHINQEIPIGVLHKLFYGLDAKIKCIIALDGDYIGI